MTGPGAFPSLDALRTAHNALLKRYREEHNAPAVLDDIEAFLNNGRDSGAYFDGASDRGNAQSMLDYWVTVLYRAQRDAPDATLVDFDPSLAPELDPASCPYLGLAAFHESNSAVFFGRERLVADLVERLAQNRILPVLGASGSGKSSLVLGGLLPALKNGRLPGSKDWFYYPPIVPGSHPLMNLAAVARRNGATLEHQAAAFGADSTELSRVAAQGQVSVLLIDQFEELFTLCTDVTERAAFAGNLLAFANAPDGTNRILITMRSDFEEKVVLLPQPLASHFVEGAVHITPLSGAELREAIEKPAARVGLKFEDGIVDELVTEVLGQPAGLPLLQFTLLKLWQRRERNRITFSAYRQLGNVRMALGKTADEFYAKLIPEDQTIVRRVMMRLVRPGEGLEVTSNRVRVTSLMGLGAADRVTRVVERLIDERLLRRTEGDSSEDAQVEVAHEALVRNWPMLVEWLETERVKMRTRLRLTAAAEQWQEHNRDPGGLLGGSLLSEAAAYDDLSELENEFVQASREDALRAEREKEQTRQRELSLERARAADAEAAAKRQALLNRWLLVAVGACLLAVVLALYQTRQANQLTDVADALNFGSEAVSHKSRGEDQDAAAAAAYSFWLGWDKHKYAEQGRIENNMRAALGNWFLRKMGTNTSKVNAVAVAPDGRRTVYGTKDGRVYAAEDASAPAWRLIDQKQDIEIVALAIAYGDTAVVALRRDEVQILPLDGGTKPVSRKWPGEEFLGMAAARNKPMVAIGTASGDVILWNYGSASEPTLLPRFHMESVVALAIDPAGEQLATGGYGNRIRLWDLRRPGQALWTVDTGDHINALEFGPGNCQPGQCGLAAASGHSVIFWEKPGTNGSLVLSQPNGIANTLTILGDRRVVAGYDDGTLIQVDLDVQKLKTLYTRNQPIKALAAVKGRAANKVRFILGDSGGDVLAAESVLEPVESQATEPGQVTWSASIDGEGRLVVGTVEGQIFGRDHSGGKRLIPDRGGELAVVALSDDGTVMVVGDEKGALSKASVTWSRNGVQITRLGDLPLNEGRDGKSGEIRALAVSANGELIAASQDGQLWIWNRGRALDSSSEPNSRIGAIAVSVDGCWLAFGISPPSDGEVKPGGEVNRKSSVRLRSVCKDVPVRQFESAGTVTSVAFSRDGGMLAFGTADGDVRWWKAGDAGEPGWVHSERKDKVTALAFGTGAFKGILVAGDEAGLVRGWNLARPDADSFNLRGHESAVKAVGFRTDQGVQTLISVGQESRVLMWRHASGLRSLLCSYGPATTDDWGKSLNRPAPKDVCPN